MIQRRIEPPQTHVGPQDHGRRMDLADFEHATVQEGYLYELGRGIIEVSDVPHPRHGAQVDELRVQMYAYRAANPGKIHRIAAGNECKILLWDLQSERHPDLAIYLKPRPRGDDFWSRWIPEIVVEIVSLSSQTRDYEDKREEYLRFGIKEYWIFDAPAQGLLVLQRVRGKWRETRLHPPEIHRTKLLPGFDLDCAAVFRAAAEADL